MRIPDIYRKKKEEGRPVFSLEVFPPKRKSNRDSIYEAVEILKETEPDFISVTYGAGGSIADFSTCEIASNIKQQYGIETLAHLTCINSSREDVKGMIQMLKDAKIDEKALARTEAIVKRVLTFGRKQRKMHQLSYSRVRLCKFRYLYRGFSFESLRQLYQHRRKNHQL